MVRQRVRPEQHTVVALFVFRLFLNGWSHHVCIHSEYPFFSLSTPSFFRLRGRGAVSVWNIQGDNIYILAKSKLSYGLRPPADFVQVVSFGLVMYTNSMHSPGSLNAYT